jgi:hypothetical protein
MSHIPLDLGADGSVAEPMQTRSFSHLPKLSSTQIGAVGEAVIGAGLMLASRGRLSPFKPLADDHGTDLLLFDKTTQRSSPLQIKCRTGFDDAAAQTVQFDVRLKTYAQEGSGFILAALLDEAAIRVCWLFSVSEFSAVAKQKDSKLVIVASAKPSAQDKYRPYRHDNLASVARKLLGT